LVLRNYQTTDIQTTTTLLDTIVTNYNWIPKGVVLKGNLPEGDNKRMKLELYYSKLNE
jgi:hypothetical protein